MQDECLIGARATHERSALSNRNPLGRPVGVLLLADEREFGYANVGVSGKFVEAAGSAAPRHDRRKPIRRLFFGTGGFINRRIASKTIWKF